MNIFTLSQRDKEVQKKGVLNKKNDDGGTRTHEPEGPRP